MTARVELDASQPRPQWAMGMVVVKCKGTGSAADGIHFRAARARQMPTTACSCRPPDISPKCPILNSGFRVISVAWILANFEGFPAH